MGLPSLIKLAPYVLALALIIGAFFYIKGIGKKECENKILIREVQSNVQRQKINHQVKGYDHDTIVAKLSDGGWLRND